MQYQIQVEGGGERSSGEKKKGKKGPLVVCFGVWVKKIPQPTRSLPTKREKRTFVTRGAEGR